MSGWIDEELIKSGKWDTKLDVVTFASSVVYFKLNKYMDGDEIDYYDADGVLQSGFGWHEMYEHNSVDDAQMVLRDALSVIAAFLSYCDNFPGNQGFICLDKNPNKVINATTTTVTKSDDCDGTPFMYIHDTGGTLGYGWNLKHHNFWPNYLDLSQWLEVSMWGDVNKCEVSVNGIPGSSWSGSLPVSEEGRAMAARLLTKITTQQLSDVFTAARCEMMRGESVAAWVEGFQVKMQEQLVGVSCPTV
jgi:hypothetical protein